MNNSLSNASERNARFLCKTDLCAVQLQRYPVIQRLPRSCHGAGKTHGRGMEAHHHYSRRKSINLWEGMNKEIYWGTFHLSMQTLFASADRPEAGALHLTLKLGTHLCGFFAISFFTATQSIRACYVRLSVLLLPPMLTLTFLYLHTALSNRNIYTPYFEHRHIRRPFYHTQDHPPQNRRYREELSSRRRTFLGKYRVSG